MPTHTYLLGGGVAYAYVLRIISDIYIYTYKIDIYNIYIYTHIYIHFFIYKERLFCKEWFHTYKRKPVLCLKNLLRALKELAG